ATPTDTPTPTLTCVRTPLLPRYCADHCEPCPTIRAGCYAQACGQCDENPVCGPGETCLPSGRADGGCCSCSSRTATATETVEPAHTRPPPPMSPRPPAA